MKYDFNGKTILITGATGLIGSNVVKTLLQSGDTARILAVIRSTEKADRIFADYVGDARLQYVICEDIAKLPVVDGQVDYIIHAANPTSSQYFVNNPVETMQTAINGTSRVLELARQKQVSGMVFLSTMEVYGTPVKGTKVDESQVGAFDSVNARNCYPLSKLACENLCYGYSQEYGVPVMIARLTQTFGPGVEYNDGRVFAEFARCAIEGRNIVLKTKGLTERCYLYTQDAVDAILTILTAGEPGQAYTVANEDTYCSIYEMASLVADHYGIAVEIQEQDVAKQGYAGTLYMDLDTSKLHALGWQPQVGLVEMYERMIEDMKRGDK